MVKIRGEMSFLFCICFVIVLRFQVVKNHNFVTANQIDEDKEVVDMCNKSIRYRQNLPGEEHEVWFLRIL